MPYPSAHAARMIQPNKFQDNTFRFINIGDANSGINAVVGKLKGEKTMSVQAYRFDKTKFTVAEAKKWLSDHDYKPLSFEAAKKS